MGASEIEAAWAEVTTRWHDESAHRAFLDGLGGLEGLAEAGLRYRAACEARPDDAVAQRWRDEVVKRATALAMAQMPRTRPPRQLPPGPRRLLLIAIVCASLGAAAWILFRIARLGAS